MLSLRKGFKNWRRRMISFQMYIKSLCGNMLCLFCMRHQSRSRINGWEDTLLGSFWLSCLKNFETVQPGLGYCYIDIFLLVAYKTILCSRGLWNPPRHDSRLVRQSSAPLPMTGLGTHVILFDQWDTLEVLGALKVFLVISMRDRWGVESL